MEIIGIISFTSAPEFTLVLAVIKTLGEEYFIEHSLEPQEALIKAVALFTSFFSGEIYPNPPGL